MESRDGGGGWPGWSDADATHPVVERRHRGDDEGDAAREVWNAPRGRRSAAAARDDAALDPLVSIMMWTVGCPGWFGGVEGWYLLPCVFDEGRPSWGGFVRTKGLD